ncbi:DegV family protein [Actinomyces faecalis]|uniref:DegV family protein n=1 Tax=Actinomyces faecalis TaxID=2722820 RepID=UPI001554CCBE|nr:DegV family protein [Actinomyces faecalis]
MSLAVVTDSAACLPPGLARRHGIEVVALHTVPGTSGAPATTSRPSVEELDRAYQDALTRADAVLALHLTAALSGTVDNARAAAARLAQDGAQVTVLDLGVSAGALGLAALAASQAQDLRHGAARARESASRSHLTFLVDDLASLRRGGRLDRTTAMMGGALGIRPLLRADERGISLVEVVRGRARARRRLVEIAVEQAGGGRTHGPRPPATPVRLAVHYGDDPADGRDLENDLADAMAEAGTQVEVILRSPADEAMRVHLGPGALGVVVAPALAQPRG